MIGSFLLRTIKMRMSQAQGLQQAGVSMDLLVPVHALHGLLLLVMLHGTIVTERAPREGAARVVSWRPHGLSIALHIREYNVLRHTHERADTCKMFLDPEHPSSSERLGRTLWHGACVRCSGSRNRS